ncbi:putative receptor-like protein kinase [Acorus calamus]|uniref:Receptor-like protein kinase n=1 Tax=Acorus calamus TaxID=4465 RepID=A0AAV9E8I1_ACOCL|nr:putative receptor-like protein kinase [Acorus calamus]
MSAVYGRTILAFGFWVLTQMESTAGADCPLDLSWSNFTSASSVCSNHDERGRCCRYINAFVAVSVVRYARVTGNLGVPSVFSETCLTSISETLELYGIPPNATIFCGFGTKIPVNYQCMGRATVMEMLQSPKFGDVRQNCEVPLSLNSNCKKCLNSGILYLRSLIGAEDNLTLSTCRDATFVALASQVDDRSAINMASCFFGVQGLGILPGNVTVPSSPSVLTPESSPSPVLSASSPSEHRIGLHLHQHHRHPYQLSLIHKVGIAVIGLAVLLLIILIILIRRKSRELNTTSSPDRVSWKALPSSVRNCQGPSSMFQKFSYKETKKATCNFCTIIGRGGFGTVYKGQFSNGFVAAVKRMDKVSEQGVEDFSREMELLGRLHHRHLVSLRGYCVAKNDRFLMYEYMENGSLKDHLHSPEQTPLSWETRIQIAIDVANALEYLHFYCDPPLCHRDIKSSNILLDENFVAKVADFGLAHASRTGAISFEPVNTDVRGTPGYMDPEYVVTQELTEKSDIYSYGVLLLELLTGRRAIHDKKNLVEWSTQFMDDESRLSDLVDPAIAGSVDSEQLKSAVEIVRWCTQGEGKTRPSIKQVLRLLYEKLDPMHGGFERVLEDEEMKGSMRANKGKSYSGDARCLQSSSSTSRSYCSRSFLLENGSPQSPPGMFSL